MLFAYYYSILEVAKLIYNLSVHYFIVGMGFSRLPLKFHQKFAVKIPLTCGDSLYCFKKKQSEAFLYLESLHLFVCNG